MLKLDEIIKILEQLNYSGEEKKAIKDIVSVFYDFNDHLKSKTGLSDEALEAFMGLHISQYKDKFNKELDYNMSLNLSIKEEIEKNSDLAIRPLEDLCIKYSYPRTQELLNISKSLYIGLIEKEYTAFSKNVLNDLMSKKDEGTIN